MFPNNREDDPNPSGWKSWQILFMIEGLTTMTIATVGFFWLPHNARTAWFLNSRERVVAEERIRQDRSTAEPKTHRTHSRAQREVFQNDSDEEEELENSVWEETHGLITTDRGNANHDSKFKSDVPLTDDRGLTKDDILSAALDWRLWYLLACNILSAIPVTAFSVFLPLVLHPMTTSPALANLMAVPPFLIGAIVLYCFAYWSDKSRQRLVPILWGLALLLVGLVGVVVVPPHAAAVRYAALCVLLSGTFIASPLTVAWFSDNIPEPGKRSVVLGINGWGNLAGVFSSLLFAPRFKPDYTIPFFVTLGLVFMAFVGYAAFRRMIIRENASRQQMVASWSVADVAAERNFGRGPYVPSRSLWRLNVLTYGEDGRRGDERLTFVYGL